MSKLQGTLQLNSYFSCIAYEEMQPTETKDLAESSHSRRAPGAALRFCFLMKSCCLWSGRSHSCFPLLFSLWGWKQHQTLLTSHPIVLESGLGFPVTKLAIRGTFHPSRALSWRLSPCRKLSQPSPLLQSRGDCATWLGGLTWTPWNPWLLDSSLDPKPSVRGP